MKSKRRCARWVDTIVPQKKFIKYSVVGIRPKENGYQPPPYKRSGIADDCPELYGIIFSRHPELCDCIKLRLSAYNL